MQESFLHFLWRFQYFNKQDLRTVSGEPVQVLRTGTPHANAGPDFFQARILIAGVEWAGNVEIHVRSSDWEAHTHQHDPAYDNVILHVVWQDDRPIHRPDGTAIPTLELHHRTDTRLLSQYQGLLQNKELIPCAGQFAGVSALEKFSMLDKVMMQRLQQKATLAETLWQANRHDWEETAYQLLAQNFGFKLNSEPFLRVSQSLPLKFLHKHRDNLLQLEAMLFGQAGLLAGTDNTEEYALALKREHTFLAHKYQLATPLAAHEWEIPGAYGQPISLLFGWHSLPGSYRENPAFSPYLPQSGSVKEMAEKLQVQQWVTGRSITCGEACRRNSSWLR